MSRKSEVTNRLYVYCVVPGDGDRDFGNLGIGEQGDLVYKIVFKDIAAVVSSTPNQEFDMSQENIFAHQRVVQKVFEKQVGVPLSFSTIAENEHEVYRLLEERYSEFKDKLGKLENSVSSSNSTQTGTKKLIEEALLQSAASAVRIRQLKEEIDELRSMRYQKAMEAAAELVMKDFTLQISTTLGKVTDAIGRLESRINDLETVLSDTNATANSRLLTKFLSLLSHEERSLEDEIRTLREEIERGNQHTWTDKH